MTQTDLPATLSELLPNLWTFAFRITGNPCAAEELTRSTCLCASARIHERPANMKPLCWIYALAYRVWIDEFCSHPRRASDVPRIDCKESVSGHVDTGSKHSVLETQIVEAVGRLPLAPRVAMLLVALEGFSYDEAAEVLAVRTTELMTYVVQARLALGREFSSDESTHRPC